MNVSSTGSLVLLLLAVSIPIILLPCNVDARTLRAGSEQMETGTAAMATHGNNRVAIQFHHQHHVQASVAEGSNSYTSTTSTPASQPATWADVPACKAAPMSSNSVKDGHGRLWGFQGGVSCAFKDPSDQHPLFYWEAAPACPGSPGPDSKTDGDGRMWGGGASCAYKPALRRKLSTWGTWHDGWGAWGTGGLTPFWQRYIPASAQYPDQQVPRSLDQPTPVDTNKEPSTPSESGGVNSGSPDHGSNAAVQDDVVAVGSLTNKLHDTDDESSGKDVAAESLAQAAAEGSAQAAAASAAAPAVAYNTSVVISHAEAHAQSTASSWTWSPTGGNITHEVQAEAHATADGVNATVKATAIAAVSADGAEAVAQGDAEPETGHDSKVYTEAGAASRALRAAEFAAPVDVSVAANPKSEDNSPSNLQAPSHAGQPEPLMTVVSGVAVGTSGTLKANRSKDSQQPKSKPQSRAHWPLTPTQSSTIASPSEDQVRDPAMTTPSIPATLPETIKAAPGAVDQASITAVSTDVTPLTTIPAPANRVIIGTAVPSTHPALASQGSAPSGDSTTPCQLVDNGSGQQSLRCTRVVAGPALNRVVAVNIAAGPVQHVAAPVASTPGSPVAPAPVSNPNNNPASVATSNIPTTVPSPLSAVEAPVSPLSAIRHTITIIHDPEVQTSGSDTLSGSAAIPGSTTSNSSRPIMPSSGLSIADYYDDEHASNDLSKNVPPQIPSNTSQLSASRSPPLASHSVLSQATSPANNATAAPWSQVTAEQPVIHAYLTAAANVTGTVAAVTAGSVPGSINLPLNSAHGAAEPAPTQSAWQQSASIQPSSALSASQNLVATSSKNLFGTTWQLAPACKAPPNKRNSVQDATGRLWWWENNHSCAYRAADGQSIYYVGYVQVKWETSPVCPFSPTLINAMADANGRAWGWITEDNVNCKFVHGSAGTQPGAAFMYGDIMG